MTDYGAEYTDKELEKMEKKIQKVYAEAQKDIQKKLDDFDKRFEAKNKIYLEKLDKGEITNEQYSHWLDGQIFQQEQWGSKKKQIIKIIQNANKEASNIINGGTINAFAENANWSHYEMEHTEGINFGFGLYDAHAVTNLIKNDPQVLPKWKVNEKKDYVWNSKKVDNAITQGIIQGERLDQITDRLVNSLSAQNRNTMLTFARTAMTGAQNAGRNQGLMDAKELGIDVVKVWMATLDDHTRASHQEIDGEEQEVGDKWHPFRFSNGCRYPGDPLGPAHEVYNCRCTLVSDIKDYPSKFKRYDNIDGKSIKNMTYAEWEAAKEKSKPSANTIINGKDISATWKRRSDQFDFEIEDVINAQGFDGKPRVVSAEEFDEAVKKSNFVAQRTYSAPDQETLDAYRDQLYDGKWYVDCSTGGAQYGRGMYCAADYTGTLTDGIREEMAHYQELNEGRGSPYSRIETLTLTKDAKVIKYEDVLPTYYHKLMGDEAVSKRAKEYGLSAKWEKAYKEAVQARLDYLELDRDKRYYHDLSELRKFARIANKKEEKAIDQAIKEGVSGAMQLSKAVYIPKYGVDVGSMAAQMGYDAINAEGHGQSGSYTVILNRTKCIFKGE